MDVPDRNTESACRSGGDGLMFDHPRVPVVPLSIVHLVTPKGEYSAVQVQVDDRVVGAEPVTGPTVAATCKLEPGDTVLRCLWVTPAGGVIEQAHNVDGKPVRGRGR